MSTWFTGDIESAGTATMKVLGPSSTPILLFASVFKLPTPVPTVAGPFSLSAPLLFAPLGATRTTGLATLPFTMPNLPLGVPVHVQVWCGALRAPATLLIGG